MIYIITVFEVYIDSIYFIICIIPKKKICVITQFDYKMSQ